MGQPEMDAVVMTDLATRALFDRGRIYVPEGKGYTQRPKPIHDPGSFERQWERELTAGETCLTFAEWLREKGWR